MLHPTDRITHTTAFVTPGVEHWLEREIAQWVHHVGSIHEQNTYHRATSRSLIFDKCKNTDFILQIFIIIKIGISF